MATSSVMQHLNWKTHSRALQSPALQRWPGDMGSPSQAQQGATWAHYSLYQLLCVGVCFAKMSRGRSAHPCIA